jgi:predicted TIM-barrel fold metal-dependent hydrolase
MNAIDIHVHNPWTRLDERPDYRIGRMKSLARLSGIDRILVLTTGMDCSPEEVRERNDCTMRLMQEDPDFFLGGMYLAPKHGRAVIRDEAARCAQAGMLAIKQLWEANARDESLDPIAEVAAELDIPLIIHGWSHATFQGPKGRPKESDGADMAHLARRHPETKIIMAHLTGVARQGVRDVEDTPNIWIDTSGGWYPSGLVEYAVRRIGADRILYGSDYPLRDYAAQIGRVSGADISEEDRERILWRNAASLLKLEGPTQ